jgi:hypothetical protein
MKMTTYNHTELRKQYEAEAAVNPQAYLNWQIQADKWISITDGYPSFASNFSYRRDPSKPPFVATTMKEQVMDRVGEVFCEEQPDGTTTRAEPTETKPFKPKRHEHADLLIAIAEGKQMQAKELDLWIDIGSYAALNRIAQITPNYVRIKPSTRTVQYRMYQWKAGKRLVGVWTSELDWPMDETLTMPVEWISKTFTVEVPV